MAYCKALYYLKLGMNYELGSYSPSDTSRQYLSKGLWICLTSAPESKWNLQRRTGWIKTDELMTVGECYSPLEVKSLRCNCYPFTLQSQQLYCSEIA
jgi:hypothetical protein